MYVDKIVRTAIRKEAMARMIEFIDGMIRQCPTVAGVWTNSISATDQIYLLYLLGVFTHASAYRLIDYVGFISEFRVDELKKLKRERKCVLVWLMNL